MPSEPTPALSARLAQYVQLFGVAIIAFLALDSLWLSITAQRLYRPAIGHLMRDGFDLGAAALFYLLYGCGMVWFAIAPSRHARQALARGAGFGLIAYATYDLTNQATLLDWPWRVTLVDLAWGAFATAASCAIAFGVAAPPRRS